MRNLLRRTLIASGLLVGLAVPAHADKTFNIGSLVIPTTSAHQSDCGAVAVYGLVYNVLRANAWLAANGHGTIEVYYTYKDSKQSPNRCTPSNTVAGPPYPGVPAPLHSDPVWNDGCDFEIYDGAVTPVRQVFDNATYPWTYKNIVTNATTGKATVWPQFATRTIDFALGATTVRYSGGPFVIDSSDAGVFSRLLSGNLIANDSAGNAVNFAPFRTGDGSCSFPADNGGYVNIHRSAAVFTAPVAKSFTAAPPRVALLATAGTATTVDIANNSQGLERKSNSGARRLTNVTTFRTKNNHGFAVGQLVTVSGVSGSGFNGTFTVVTSGVPTARYFTVNNPGPNVTEGGGAAVAPGITHVGTDITVNTASNHGFAIGDLIDIANVNNAAAPVGPGASFNGTYNVASVLTPTRFTITTLAAPQRYSGGDGDVGKSVVTTSKVSNGILQKYLRLAGLQFVGAGGCPPGAVNAADPVLCPIGANPGQIYDTFDFGDLAAGRLAALSGGQPLYKMIWTPHWETSANSTTAPTVGEQLALTNIASFLDGQTGLMAECHSIEAFEGAYRSGAADEQGVAQGQYQTCRTVGGVCSGTTPFGMHKDMPGAVSNNVYLPNCSDPNRVLNDDCAYYSAPGDSFAQPGDYLWYSKSGSVEDYIPNAATSSAYRTGVKVLISGVANLNPALVSDPTAARAMIQNEFVSRSSKDNDTSKGNILYMAGHDVSGVVSGTKVILQTLLLLGEPPIVTTMEEVSRASPIIAAIGGVNAIIQGSFEQLTPAGSTTTADNDSQVAGFQFPDVKGHMRAVDITTVSAQTPIKDLVEIFDVADVMADASNSYTGCGANAYGAGAGNCRTVFTHTDAGVNGTAAQAPAVLFEDTAAANTALKAAINIGGGTIGSGVPTDEFPAFLQKIIGGGLGGVDRSTVAVIPSSTVVPGATARPTIIYFGGTDGMLHAVCGSTTTGAPCDVLGRELWAFVPRRQLPYLRKNRARVDGSVRVLDVFADLDGTGGSGKGFKTLLVFQTTNGDPVTAGQEPSMTALDVSDPTAPKIVWDYALPGQGLVVNVGRVSLGGVNKYLAFAQTNAGTGASGNVVTAVDVETGLAVWTSGGPAVGAPYLFTPGTPPARLSGTVPPVTGIPGGAVGVDTAGAGNVTDVVFGTLYGDLWQLDAATGVNRHGTTPLFQYSTDEHPIGAPPTIFGDGSLYALAAPGGYADLAATTLWSAVDQKAVAVRLHPDLPATVTLPLTESSGPPGVKWTFAMASGDKVYSQPVVSGGSVYISAESLDANQLAYGSVTGDTGRVYRIPLAPPCTDTAPADGICDNAPALTAGDALSSVVAGGVSSVVIFNSEVFVVGKNMAQKLGSSDATAGGTAGTSMNTDGTVATAVTTGSVPRVSRKMWLQTL